MSPERIEVRVELCSARGLCVARIVINKKRRIAFKKGFFYTFYYFSTDTTVTGINRPTVEATGLNKRGQNPRKGFRLSLTQYIAINKTK